MLFTADVLDLLNILAHIFELSIAACFDLEDKSTAIPMYNKRIYLFLILKI